MTRTFVTGVAGFTGRYLAERLAAQGHEVHGLVHEGSPDIPGVAKLHRGDLTSLADLKRIVAEVEPRHVVHLAAISHVSHEDVAEIYRTNVVGTRHLLAALAGSRVRPDAVLLASSAQVYNRDHEGVIDETALPDPANDYGISKLASEQIGRLFSDRLPVITVRPFNYTGRGQSDTFLIPKIVAHAKRRADVIELGNLEVARDFSDVRCVVDAYVRLLETPTAIGATFNVCSGEATTLRTVLDQVAELSGHALQVRVNPAFVRPNEVKLLLGSAHRLEQTIGPIMRLPLADTLRWMLQD